VKCQGHSVAQLGQKFAKLSITQPGMVRFRSHLEHTWTFWHPVYHKCLRS